MLGVPEPGLVRGVSRSGGLHETPSVQVGHSQSGNPCESSGLSSGVTSDLSRKTRTVPAWLTSYTFSVIGTALSLTNRRALSHFTAGPDVTP